MKKKTIFAGNYDMASNHCIGVILSLILIGLVIYLANSLTPEPLYETLVNLVVKAAIFFFSVLTLVKLFYALKNLQFVVMNEEGLRFKNGFGNLGFVAWSDIESAKKDEVLVYQVVGGRRSSRITKVMDKFYVIVSTDYHVYPSLQLNPKHGGIARTIPAPDSRFEEQLYFYRPDLKPEPPREDDEE